MLLRTTVPDFFCLITICLSFPAYDLYEADDFVYRLPHMDFSQIILSKTKPELLRQNCRNFFIHISNSFIDGTVSGHDVVMSLV